MDELHDEAGFTLIEVAICVALIVAACVAGMSALPALVRESESGVLRDAATGLARSAVERVRAATAYYPPSGFAANHAYALNASSSYAAAVRVHRDWCGAKQTTTIVPMNVTLAYDAATDTLTATVVYPRSACDSSATTQVVVSAPLAPSALAPGTAITTAIGDPSQQ
jgi:prepilin-type N-terminal cleavage/methylation domain-containing protein